MMVLFIRIAFELRFEKVYLPFLMNKIPCRENEQQHKQQQKLSFRLILCSVYALCKWANCSQMLNSHHKSQQRPSASS